MASHFRARTYMACDDLDSAFSCGSELRFVTAHRKNRELKLAPTSGKG